MYEVFKHLWLRRFYRQKAALTADKVKKLHRKNKPTDNPRRPSHIQFNIILLYRILYIIFQYLFFCSKKDFMIV